MTRSKNSVLFILDPDVRSAVASRVTDFMGKRWSLRLCPKVHIEILVEGETSINRVHIKHDEEGSTSKDHTHMNGYECFLHN